MIARNSKDRYRRYNIKLEIQNFINNMLWSITYTGKLCELE